MKPTRFFSAEKIWPKNLTGPDRYADFLIHFDAGKEKARLDIVCDGAFVAYLNGEPAAFGESADFPNRKEFDSFPLAAKEKGNTLLITVWHTGIDTQTYIKDAPFLAFSLFAGKKKIKESDKTVLCRENPHYVGGRCRLITRQLGFGFAYDASAPETAWETAATFGRCKAEPRGIKTLKLEASPAVKIRRTKEGFLSSCAAETVGFPELSVTSDLPQKLTVSFGEHLRGGHVARIIGDRDFSFEVTLPRGETSLLLPLRRIAGRYLELIAEQPEALAVSRLSIRPTVYPITQIRREFENPLDRAIYRTSVRTLRACMHQHYEDCPWREQALYAMDSRNQMLCGYYVFRKTDFARHNLLLLARSLRPDGLLSICAPAGYDLPIPSFSLIYPIAVAEYIAHTGDRSILDEAAPVMNTILSTFSSRIGEDGLIPIFPAPCWNFYEWSEGSDHTEEMTRDFSSRKDGGKRRDLILNCLYLRARAAADGIFGTFTDTSDMKKAIVTAFYDKRDGLFYLDSLHSAKSVLGNALALLVGIGGKDLAEKLVSGKGMVPITLSMATFLYDALLAADFAYRDFVLRDIRTKYKKMLDAGATTFWETEEGADAFGGAGSLCHGWSAIPAYYLSVLTETNG